MKAIIKKKLNNKINICITSRSISVDRVFVQNYLKPQAAQCADGPLSCLVRVQVWNLILSFSFIWNWSLGSQTVLFIYEGWTELHSLRAMSVVFVSSHFNVTEKWPLQLKYLGKLTYQTTLNFKLITSFCTNNVKRLHWHKLQAGYFSLGLHFKLTKRSS